MNSLAKQIRNSDGDLVPKKERRWHLVTNYNGDDAMFCTGEFVVSSCGDGEYERKVSERGITCETCRSLIKEIKKVKL